MFYEALCIAQQIKNNHEKTILFTHFNSQFELRL